MGLHTGEVRVRGGDHVDYTPINRCARVRAAGHGGQGAHQATGDLVAGGLGGGFGLKRLGEFRLRDLAEPELIFQLIHPDGQSTSRPFAPLLSAPNLPLQVSPSSAAAGSLRRWPRRWKGCRCATLTGAGGVGKTRLALQVAGQVSPRFGDGAWLLVRAGPGLGRG